MATDERTDITEVKISEKDIEFYGLRDKFLNEEIDKKIDEIENSFKNLNPPVTHCIILDGRVSKSFAASAYEA